MKLGPLSLLVVQATPFCNIDCRYCYLSDRHRKGVMSDETLRALFQRVYSSSLLAGEFSLVWHAGEPLVLPIDFYEKAYATCAAENRSQVKTNMCFQTNATLIDDRWCRFFKETDSRIGVSLDGPKFLHDRYRRTRQGRGTFARTMRGVRLLQAHGVSFSVICVLTAEALDAPEEIFRFFVGNGIRRVGFNLEEIEGVNATSTVDPRTAYARFRDFLERLLALNAGEELDIREVRWFRNFLRVERARELGDQCEPFRVITVDHRGGFSTFSPELHGVRTAGFGEFVFGNVREIGFEDSAKTPRFAAALREIEQGVARCEAECAYFAVCGGGVPANKLFENGSFASTETMYCRTRVKALTDVMLARIEGEVAPGEGAAAGA